MKLRSRLETERLILRTWRLRDLKPLYHLCSDPELAGRAGFHALNNYVDAWIRLVYCYMSGTGYAITDKSGQLIGSISFMDSSESHIPLELGQMEAGYWIGRPYWGHEYASEAAEAAIDALFESRMCSSIICLVDETNEQSHRVQEKLGFQYNRHESIPALKPDHRVRCAVFQMTQQDWRCSRT